VRREAVRDGKGRVDECRGGRADGLSFPHASFFVLEHEGKDKLLAANEL